MPGSTFTTDVPQSHVPDFTCSIARKIAFTFVARGITVEVCYRKASMLLSSMAKKLSGFNLH